MPGAGPHIGKEFGRQDVEALFRHRLGPAEFGIGVAQAGVVEIGNPGLAFLFVEKAGQVLRDEAVEQHAEHVGLEVPAIHAAAQIVGNAPDGLVQFRPFVFFVLAISPFNHSCSTTFVPPRFARDGIPLRGTALRASFAFGLCRQE